MEDQAFSANRGPEGEAVHSPSSYPYKGMPLTPAIIADLAGLMFAGRLARRNEISAAISEYHIENGGAPSQASAVQQTKKALSTMQKSGQAEQSGGYGLWRFPPLDGSEEWLGLSTSTQEAGDVEDDDVEEPIRVEHWSGSGSECVYVYSYPAYRLLAEARGEPQWPIKIGRSTVDPSRRVRDQVGTGTPEWPVIHLAIRTPHAADLERMLHAALRLAGRQLDSPGAEWFLASPEWVIECIQATAPNVLEGDGTANYGVTP